MAQLLYERDSTRKHLSATHRHMRLCRQFNGTQSLVDQVQLPYNAFRDKHEATRNKREQREDRYDDLLTADNQLDDQVRLVFRRCEEHDRATPAEAVMPRVFPEGKFGHIVNMNLQYENNYLDARKQFGKSRAERLFPKLNNVNRSSQLVEEDESDEEMA